MNEIAIFKSILSDNLLSRSQRKNPFSTEILVVSRDFSLKRLFDLFQDSTAKNLTQALKRNEFKIKPGSFLTLNLTPDRLFSILVLPHRFSTFSSLEWARQLLSDIKAKKGQDLLVHLAEIPAALESKIVDSFTAAAVALEYEPPQYRKAKKEKSPAGHLTLTFSGARTDAKELTRVAQASQASTQKTNLVRHLTQRAGNDLTPATYLETAKKMASAAGLNTHFYSIDQLIKMKAGAFLAVAQGAPKKEGGILKLTYTPKGHKHTIALVGKGITFDTGGNNLKTGSHMFGMNNDMAGSAVVLALCLLAAQEKWPFQVVGYLAITENLLGPQSYRPNDVVTSLRGKTIEVVDTDAEGRMILADTLTLASREKPHLVIDFATLTGSVIRSLGTQYSGGYSNRKRLLSRIRQAGVQSGERVWPFPNDADYGRCLKSDIADIKQCRLTGGVDHIEAAFFLSQFVEKGVDWIHLDLGAMDPEEPLAHIPKKPSGFGVRVTRELIFQLFSGPNAPKAV